MIQEPRKTGTTTVGIVCNDGIILASEMRATVAGYIASEEVEKTYEIDKHIGMTAAGAAGDILAISRILAIETKLYKTRNGRPIGVEGAVNLLSNILYQYKMMPFMAAIIFGGVEANGEPKLFILDPSGDIIRTKDHSAFGGSGWFSAQAVLDTCYEKGNVKDLIPLAVKAIKTAMKRDTASGGDASIVTITKEGFKRLDKAEVERIVEKDKQKEKKKY